jgi:DNA-directed RNA polymerase II subunit RPB1
MDIVKVARIYFDPRDNSTIIGADQEWLSFFMAYEEISAPAPVGTESNAIASTNEETDAGGQAKSPWILRFELDRDKMFLKNITMEDVMYVISRRYDNIETAYTDYNADELVIRVRLSLKNKDPMDDLIALKKFQSNILTNTLVRGITGLRAVTFSVVKDYYELVNNRYEKIEQFVLDTDGTNFLDVACHPDIDCTKLYSNNIHDIYANLGVEATRAVLLKEISGLFEDNNVNFRHFGLLCDVICSKGKLMTVDRYGINKNNIGPLAKASFEQTEDIMLRAALFGELDPVTGVSANIMTGQPIRGGTSFSTVLLDEDALRKFTSESIGVDLTVEREEEFTEEDQENALYHARTQGKKDDACAIPRLRLEATIPEQKEVSTEYTDMEITFVDE